MLGWECMFYHVELQVILSVYVDDFKMAGKQDNMSKAWQLMDKAGLKLDRPQPFGDYLGCGQAPLVLTKEQAKERLQHIDPIRIGSGGYGEPDGSADKETNHPIRAIRYDMRGFLVQCIEKYLELAKLAKDKLKLWPRQALTTTRFPRRISRKRVI